MEERSQPIEPRWLCKQLDLNEWLARQPHPKLLARNADLFRSIHEDERAAVRSVIESGDELWTWKESFCDGPPGAWGYALVRDGKVANCWCVAVIM